MKEFNCFSTNLSRYETKRIKTMNSKLEFSFVYVTSELKFWICIPRWFLAHSFILHRVFLQLGSFYEKIVHNAVKINVERKIKDVAFCLDVTKQPTKIETLQKFENMRREIEMGIPSFMTIA